MQQTRERQLENDLTRKLHIQLGNLERQVGDLEQWNNELEERILSLERTKHPWSDLSELTRHVNNLQGHVNYLKNLEIEKTSRQNHHHHHNQYNDDCSIM